MRGPTLVICLAGALAASCGGWSRPPDPMTAPPHACEAFVEPQPVDSHPAEPARAYFATRHGCAFDATDSNDTACGTFPCTAGGCYVGTCGSDSDCAHGLCSHYASRPRGYCVQSDPH